MANTEYKKTAVWLLDTVGVITTKGVSIDAIFLNGGAANTALLLSDADGNVVAYLHTQTGKSSQIEFPNSRRAAGLTLTTLTAGSVYVYLKPRTGLN